MDAATILAAATETTDRFDGDAWISLVAGKLGMTVEDLGAQLWDLQAAGEIRIRRCDLPTAIAGYRHDLDSEVAHPMLSTAVAHLVVLDSEALRIVSEASALREFSPNPGRWVRFGSPDALGLTVEDVQEEGWPVR